MAVLFGPSLRRLVLIASASLLVGAAISLALSGESLAKDFRIHTRIFVGEETEPVSETTTLFLDGVVYDFLAEPAQVAVFRKPAGNTPGRFILLNPKLRVRTELTTAQIDGAMNKLRMWAGKQTDPFLKFAADPKFKESFESESGQLILASHIERYTVATSPAEHPQALEEYREFLDWYARLNTLLLAGPPPEPRLHLNAALSRHRVLPSTVELSRSGEAQPLRAVHQFTWRLSRDDADQIDGVRASLASYREVSNDIFLRSMQPENSATK